MVDLRDYFAILRRRFFVVVILASLGLGLALGYSKLQTPLYTATAHVLINAPPGGTSQNLSNVISVDTEAQVARSAPIAIAAAAEIGTELIPTQLLKHVSVSSTPNTFVLDISYWDPNPTVAALGANAFANAYLDNRKKQADELIKEQESSIEAQIGELQREQRVENGKLEAASRGRSHTATRKTRWVRSASGLLCLPLRSPNSLSSSTRGRSSCGPQCPRPPPALGCH